MTDRIADTALRLLAPRASVLGTGDGDSLQNIDTTILANGSLCWVNANATLYRLDKLSVAASAPDAVIVPASGPGRWVALSNNELVAEGRMSMFRPNAATVVIATINVWVALPVEAGPAYFPQVPGAAFWSIAPTTGVATYSGPSMIYHFKAAMNLAAGETAAIVPEMALTVNNEDIGITNARDLSERVAVGTTTSFEGLAIANEIALAPGDTVQLIARNTSGAQDLILSGIQIIGIPVGTEPIA
jgi:hypothetical protein